MKEKERWLSQHLMSVIIFLKVGLVQRENPFNEQESMISPFIRAANTRTNTRTAEHDLCGNTDFLATGWSFVSIDWQYQFDGYITRCEGVDNQVFIMN